MNDDWNDDWGKLTTQERQEVIEAWQASRAQRPPASPHPDSEKWRSKAERARALVLVSNCTQLTRDRCNEAFDALIAAADACDDMERGWAKALIALTSANADNAKLRELLAATGLAIIAPPSPPHSR